MPPIKLFEFDGRSMTLRQWANETGLRYSCVQSRFKQGTPLDKPRSKRGRPLGSTNAKSVDAK
jgi:hypothetical protein